MKRVKIFFISSIILFFMSFQKYNDTSRLYLESLLYYLPDIHTDTIYILKCFDLKLPSKIEKYNIVDIEDNIKSILEKKGSFYALKIMPIQLDKEIIEITIIEYFIKEEEKNVIMSNTGSEVFKYRYDYKQRKYKLVQKIKNTI